jgi:hypothetical protein
MFLRDGWQRTLPRGLVKVANGDDPKAILELGLPIGVLWRVRDLNKPAIERDVLRALRLVHRTLSKALSANSARSRTSLLRRLEPFLPTVVAPVSFTVYAEMRLPERTVTRKSAGTLEHYVQWWKGAEPKPSGVAALALAALLADDVRLWEELRRCPECGLYFWKDGKRRYCTDACANEVHKRQIQKHKTRARNNRR